MSLIKRFLLLYALCFVFPHLVGQKVIPNTAFSSFELKTKQDTISFMVSDTVFSAKKPILLFCQGSLPVPLVFQFDGTNFPAVWNNFDLTEANKHFYVVSISMPHVPLIVTQKNINASYQYVPDTANPQLFDPLYLKGDYLANYVRRANAVLRFLYKQPWVEPSKTVALGHSQGSRVALALAVSNSSIKQLGLLGNNVHSRMDQIIWDIRHKAERGEITWEEAEQQQKENYAFHAEYQNEGMRKQNTSHNTWYSFSKDYENELTSLKIPVYIAYGSNDPVAQNTDLLPLRFIEAQKFNFQMVRYANCEHNFFPLVEGKPDYENGKWNEVFNAFVSWSLHPEFYKIN